MSIAKGILIDELNEQGHPEDVESVIFWALEYYAENKKENTWGKAIAHAIKQRILDEESDQGECAKAKDAQMS